MNNLLFLLISTIENFSLFILSFAIFMLPVRNFIPHIIFGSIIIAQASYLIHDVLNLSAIAPLLLLVIFFVFLWLMFRIQIFYSAIISTMGYILYIFLQTVLALALNLLFPLNELTDNSLLTRFLQLITAIIALVISWFFSKKRLGFSFVPDREKDKFIFKGQNKIFLLAILIASISIAGLYLFFLDGIVQMIITIILLIIILGILFFLALKKENSL